MRAAINFVVLVLATAVAGLAIPYPTRNDTVPICHDYTNVVKSKRAETLHQEADGTICAMGGF